MTATTEHKAVMTPVRRRKGPPQVKVGVKCGCGARAIFMATPCEGERCPGLVHVTDGGVWHVGARDGMRACPALVLVVRILDATLPAEAAERIVAKGSGGLGL